MFRPSRVYGSQMNEDKQAEGQAVMAPGRKLRVKISVPVSKAAELTV